MTQEERLRKAQERLDRTRNQGVQTSQERLDWAYDPNAGAYTGPSVNDEQQAVLDAIEQMTAPGPAEQAVGGYLTAQEQLSQDQKIMDEDMKILGTWSKEDQEALHNYARYRRGGSMSTMDVLAGGHNPLPELWYHLQLMHHDPEEVERLAESYMRYENAQTQKEVEKAAEKQAGSFLGSVAGSAASVPASIAGAITGPVSRLGEAVTRTGRYSTLDPNNAGSVPSQYAGQVRGKVAQNIEGENGNKVRKLGSLAYQGLMSAADSLARVALTGSEAASLGLAGLGSFNESVSSASAKGATPAQAVIQGVADGGIEVLTEKIPLDNVFRVAKGGVSGAKSIIKEAMKQAGIEATSEEIGMLASLAVEAANLREKSEYKQTIGQLVTDGMSYDDAVATANRQFWDEAVDTAVSSAISGGVMSGASMAYGALHGTTEDSTVVDAEPEATPKETLEVETPMEPAVEAPVETPAENVDNSDLFTEALAEAMDMPTENAAETVEPQAAYDEDEVDVDVEMKIPAQVGKSGQTFTSGNNSVDFRYAIVPMESLIASNDIYGNVNPKFPAQLQPRDRHRATSQQWVSQTGHDLNPKLLAESPTAQNGAPIIREDGVVIGGNGRVSAINVAYNGGEPGQKYRDYIAKIGPRVGIDTTSLPEHPVLVRVAGNVADEVKLASDLNATTTHQFSSTELAVSDAKGIEKIIEHLSPTEDGDITDANNHDFIQHFVDEIAYPSERGQIVDDDGKLSIGGLVRIQNAIFAYAYNDLNLIKNLAENINPESKNLRNAMLASATKMAKLTQAIRDGEVQNLGFREALVEGANIFKQARDAGETVTDYTSQLGFTGETDDAVGALHNGLAVNLALFMEENTRGYRNLVDFIDLFIKNNLEAESAEYTSGGLFGETEKLTQEDLYDRAVEQYREKKGDKAKLPPKRDFELFREFVAETLGGTGTEGSTEESGSVVGDDEDAGRLSEDAPAEVAAVTEALSDEGIRTPEITETVAEESAEPTGTIRNDRTVETPTGFNEFGTEENRSVGSAGAGFSPYSEAEGKYGVIPERFGVDKDTVRYDDVPVSMDGDKKVSYVARTIKGAEITPDSLVEDLENKVVQNGMSYVPISNDETTQNAAKHIAEDGWEVSIAKWKNNVRNKKAGADMSATGAILLNNAAAAGDKALWLDLLGDMQKLSTNTAQGLQALKIIKQLAPEDKLYMMKKSVQKMADELGIDGLKVPDDLAKAYEEAKTDKERDAVIKDIQKAVANQVPSTVWDKWNALRYLNMLGNFKTQVRNVSGNVAMQAAYRVKDALAAGLERVFVPKEQRTKSFTVSRDLLKETAADFENYKNTVVDGGKYGKESTSDSFQRGVEEERTIFKTKPLEWYRRTTNWAMNNELFGDAAFARKAYARAMAGFLKARGATGSLDSMDPQLLDAARRYAIQQAQEATFHDNNVVSSWISKIGRRHDTPKAVKALSEGIMPFRKTPANVLVRAEEFSPLGLVNSAVETIKAAQGNATGAEVVDSWAKSLTGTGLAALGYFLARNGMLNGGPDDDDDRDAFDRMTGQQSYSLNLPGGYNMTIDFLSPTAMPLLLGAQLADVQDMTDLSMKDMEKVFLSLADPMISMSMLQGINDTIDRVKFSEDNLGQFVLDSATGYLSQGLTNTLLGQLERSSEDSRMTTYVDEDSKLSPWAQRQLGKASAKTPGADFQQIPYLDAWGEEQENMDNPANAVYQLLSPSYISKDEKDPLNEELKRLDDAQSDINVLPRAAKRKISYTDSDGVKHEDYGLSAEEWTAMQRTQGQTAKKILSAVIDTDAYKSMSDADKARAVQAVYDYAREKGKEAALPDYEADLGGRLGYMETAIMSGVDVNAFVDLYGQYYHIGQQDTKAGQKATQWAYVLDKAQQAGDITGEQKEALKDDMRFWSMVPAEAGNYDKFTGEGIKPDVAQEFSDALYDLSQKNPNARPIDRIDAIAGTGASADDVADAISAVLTTDSQREKMETMLDAGYSPKDYADVYRAYLDGDKKAGKTQAIARAIGRSADDPETLALYKLFSGR